MKTQSREFEYYLLRYVPDPVREEFINVGVIVREKLRDAVRDPVYRPYLGFCAANDLAILKSLDPNVSLEFVREQVEYLEQRILGASTSASTKEGYDLIKELATYSNILTLSPAKGLSAANPEAALMRLKQTYLR